MPAVISQVIQYYEVRACARTQRNATVSARRNLDRIDNQTVTIKLLILLLLRKIRVKIRSSPIADDYNNDRRLSLQIAIIRPAGKHRFLRDNRVLRNVLG